MDTPQAPAAPDPAQLAKEQGTANRETAVTQYGLNATNQKGPQGSLSYNQIGTWADGTPRFEATTAYSPGEQGIYDTGVQTRQNVANIGRDQSARVADVLATPFNIDAERGKKISDIQRTFLDPEWQGRGADLEASNIAKGLRPGSEAYTRSNQDFADQRARAYDQAYLDSYKTAEGSALTERNQPINEITALMSGSQVSNPNFVNTPMPGVAPTDVIGANAMSLGQQNKGWEAQVGNQRALMSGLFGLAGAGVKAAGTAYGAG